MDRSQSGKTVLVARVVAWEGFVPAEDREDEGGNCEEHRCNECLRCDADCRVEHRECRQESEDSQREK